MILHDSQSGFYRSPFGAAPCGETVSMRITTDELCSKVTLRFWLTDHEEVVPMHLEAPDTYGASYALPNHPCLAWYYFILDLEDGGRVYYGNAHDNMGGVGQTYRSEPPSYQITVYDRAYSTPGWMRDGLMYHIMVDRFNASKPVSERKPPRDGHWHQDWYDDPELNFDTESTDNFANDFFGGDLKGIEQKLTYLKDFGVTVIYLSPVFQARSNHKYNTGDYMKIDPSFGTERDFKELCQAAKAQGIRVMLDGVFSHTGSDSRYFNKNGNYKSIGAYQSKDSQYHSWFNFIDWPNQYETWWGFQTLPVVNKWDANYQDFLVRSDDSVLARWVKKGASGWRLDVADELPMQLLREMRSRLKGMNADNAILGEVWDDASVKIAYGELRCYCLGDTLDSVMNYPLREALFDFLLYRTAAADFARRITHIQENYPRPFFYALMNMAGSHDKARAINVLSDAFDMEPLREGRSAYKLTDDQYALGRRRFLLAWQFLVTMPGMPCMYYGDEAGVEGMADPFCRATYPWGREDSELLEAVRDMNSRRHSDDIWVDGDLRLLAPDNDVLVCLRDQHHRVGICAINRSNEPKTVRFYANGEGSQMELTIGAMASDVRIVNV